MSDIVPIIAAILAIFIVILIHELGHFFVARLTGVKVQKFSIGFGKALWSHTGKSGTQYIIAMLPLGGYVKMLGEGDELAPGEDKSCAYDNKSVLVRIAIAVAGPITNFLLAAVLFWIIFLGGVTHIKPIVGQITPNSIAAKAGMRSGEELRKINGFYTRSWQRVVMALIAHMGDKGELVIKATPKNSKQMHTYRLNLANWQVNGKKPQIFKSLGFKPYQPAIKPIVNTVLPNSPASRAGLRKGDYLHAVDGQSIKDWMNLINVIRARPNQEVSLSLTREGKPKTIKLMVGSKHQGGKEVGYMGMTVKGPAFPADLKRRLNFNVLTAWLPAIEQTWMLTYFNSIVLAKMIIGKISIHALGGPITIFQGAGQASKAGVSVYLAFIAFISVTLGFINLLPIPGLDGGHILFYLIEAVARRPVPQRVQMLCLKVGILLLVTLMVVATLNDIMRIW